MVAYVDRQLRCFICSRNLIEVDRDQWVSSRMGAGTRALNYTHSSGSGITIQKVLTCPVHQNFYLFEIAAPKMGQIMFDRDAMTFIKKSLGLRTKLRPSQILGGNSVYYNIQYSLGQRFRTFFRGRIGRKEFSSKFPLDSLILMISSIVEGTHFTMYGVFDGDTRKFLIVNVIREW